MAFQPAGKSVVVQDIYSKGGGRRIQGRSRSRSPGTARGTPPAFPIDPFSLPLLRLPQPSEVQTFTLERKADKFYEAHPVYRGTDHELQFREADELWHSEIAMVVYKPPYRHMAFDHDGERGDYETSMTKTMRDKFSYPTVTRTARGTGKGAQQINGCNAGLAHRLDKETSGCVLVGKTDEAWESLREQFDEKGVYKEYICLANGVIKQRGFVDKHIKPANLNVNGSKSKVVTGEAEGGLASLTVYEPIQYYRRAEDKRLFTLLRCRIHNGRRHQIRVHMSSIDAPLVSDSLYSYNETWNDREILCARLFLHHYRVGFHDPASKKRVYVKCPLPSDLNKVLKSLHPVRIADVSDPHLFRSVLRQLATCRGGVWRRK
jgi:23S rRNA-/tRNA-specific pseudouridylate synthase